MTKYSHMSLLPSAYIICILCVPEKNEVLTYEQGNSCTHIKVNDLVVAKYGDAEKIISDLYNKEPHVPICMISVNSINMHIICTSYNLHFKVCATRSTLWK